MDDITVPQVGELIDVKGLPWLYTDFDRWTSATQRGWVLAWLRTWLPTQAWVRKWSVRESAHAGTSMPNLVDPYLVLTFYKADGTKYEGSTFFDVNARAAQDAFTSRLASIGNALAEAAAL